MRPRFLIISFDGLRPDLLDPQLTPNLCRLQALGVTLAEHRTIYPSETRAAFPSLVTGATPNRHGMVGNQYVDRTVSPPRAIDTSDAILLRQLDRASGGHLMTAATLGEVLAAAGLNLAMLSTNTAGTTRLFHHKAEDFGHVRLSGHFREACTPPAFLDEAETLAGPLPTIPPDGEPDLAGQTWITSVLLDLVWPKVRPDVAILAFGEPDTSSHLNGTGAQKTREAIAHCDREFGRVLDWWEAEGQREGVQIIALSDHGHITAHTRVSVADSLRAAGYQPGPAPGPDVDVVIIPGQVGALYLAEPTNAALARLGAALTEMEWCGPLFTRPKDETFGVAPGSLGSHLVFGEHARAPDVAFSFRADDGLDPFGLVGGTFYDSPRPPGLGVHGGLHRKEMRAVGVLAGSAFPSGVVSDACTNICDIAPTVLALLGLDTPATMTGRPLAGTIGGRSTAPEEEENFEARRGTYRQVLTRKRVGSSIYVIGGWAGRC